MCLSSSRRHTSIAVIAALVHAAASRPILPSSTTMPHTQRGIQARATATIISQEAVTIVKTSTVVTEGEGVSVSTGGKCVLWCWTIFETFTTPWTRTSEYVYTETTTTARGYEMVVPDAVPT